MLAAPLQVTRFRRLELNPETQADLALRIVATHARDLPERGRGEVAIRVVEDPVIQDVASLHPDFDAPRARKREGAEHGEVEVVAARAVELVAPRRPEPDPGRLRERQGIEPRARVADLAGRRERADQ